MIRIELSGVPQGKGRGRAVNTPAGVRVYTPKKTVTYESQLRYAATQVMAGRAPLQGPVRVVMTMRFPVPASWSKKNQAAALAGQIRPTIKPDWDNGAKLCDAINMVVFLDDKQVVDGRVIKLYSERPGLTIEVESAFIEIEEKPLSSDPRTQSFALPRITNPKQLDML